MRFQRCFDSDFYMQKFNKKFNANIALKSLGDKV